MGRYNPNSTAILYHPTALRLRTSAHRASLDRNDVAVLSGRDPKEYGSIGRMPGGKYILSASGSVTGADEPVQAIYVPRNGVKGGYFLRTTVTASFTPPSGGEVDITVNSSAGFGVEEWIACWDANNTFVARITEIVGNVVTVATSGSGGGDGTDIEADAVFVRCFPHPANLPSGSATSTIVLWMESIENGQTVRIVGNRDGANATETIVVKECSRTIATFMTNTTKTHSSAYVLLPVFEDFDYDEIFCAQADGSVFSIIDGAAKEMWITPSAQASGFVGPTWSFCRSGNQILASNGHDPPVRLTTFTGEYTVAAGSVPPVNTVGMPDSQSEPVESTDYNNIAGGNLSAGAYRVRIRLVDKSFRPYTYSPILWEFGVDVNVDDKIWIDLDNFFTNAVTTDHRRATHLQVWATVVDSSVYHLVDDRHLSYYLTTSGVWKTGSAGQAYLVSDSDLARVLGEVMGDNDVEKGLMPNGRGIHCSQGVTFIAGATAEDAIAGSHPRVLTDDILHFSRTDVEEPENFPADNFKTLEDIWVGYIDAADTTVILCRNSFIIAQRAGTFMTFTNGGVYGQGCAHPYAYCSLGTHAAWVGDRAVWLFDGRSLGHPRDIGHDIRDWIGDLHDSAVDRVRMQYDPVNRLLWIGKVEVDGSGDLTNAECKVYSFDEDAWFTREALILDAPVSAVDVEPSGNNFTEWALYRFGGSDPVNMYRVVDYTDEPLVDGGWSAGTYTMDGALVNTKSLTILNDSEVTGGLTWPAGTDKLVGLCVLFLHADGTESIRDIISSSGDLATLGKAVSVTAGDKFVVGAVPFRLRFPPIRGENPFAAKKILGSQALLDNVRYDSGDSEDATMTLTLLRNMNATPATGAQKTFKISDDPADVATDFATAAETTGEVVECEITQVDRHVDFSLIYLSLEAYIPGTTGGDQSTSV